MIYEIYHETKFNYGAIVGHVSPEAYDGGEIALIENGDEIEMDIAVVN